MNDNVTLIIPTYRNPKYLDLCLKSAVKNRVDPNNHIIVIVDGFGFESADVLYKYEDDVFILELPENKGMQSALNMGVMQAETKYVFIINDDNVMPKNWDTRVLDAMFGQSLRSDTNRPIVLTVDQIEPTGPGMFNFPVRDFGQTVETFDYDRWLAHEVLMSEDMSVDDGHIFPFMMEKKYYMAVGGFDTFYNSPNVVDWDFFLKLELLDFVFPRTRRLRLYHFGSVSTRKNSESQLFIARQNNALLEYQWKWGCQPHNKPNVNSKVPTDGKFRGFQV